MAVKFVEPPWRDVPYLLDRMCAWLDEIQPPDATQQIPYAFIKAVVAHVYIEWVHPFGNGNGRLGRLVEFLILISSGVPLPAAHVLTSHYNDTRTEYYRQLNIASRNGGDLRGFLDYAAQGCQWPWEPARTRTRELRAGGHENRAVTASSSARG